MNRRLDALIGALPLLSLLAFLVLGGWLAARWFWYFASSSEPPTAPPRNRVVLGAAAQTAADAHLFGAASTPGGGETISNLNIKLKGVFASNSDAPAYAIINTGNRDETARAGGEIVPGVVLESVHPEHVVLRRNGALERVNLEERIYTAAAVPSVGLPAAAPPGPRTRAARRAAQVAPPPPPPPSPAPQFQRPEPFAPVGDVPTGPAPAPGAQPSAGTQPPPPAPPGAPGAGGAQAQASPRGLVIQTVPVGSALERLGLQPGDVIRSVNGEAVTSEADIVRIMQQRGIQGSFTAEVVRGGLTLPIAVGGATR